MGIILPLKRDGQRDLKNLSGGFSVSADTVPHMRNKPKGSEGNIFHL